MNPGTSGGQEILLRIGRCTRYPCFILTSGKIEGSDHQKKDKLRPSFSQFNECFNLVPCTLNLAPFLSPPLQGLRPVQRSAFKVIVSIHVMPSAPCSLRSPPFLLPFSSIHHSRFTVHGSLDCLFSLHSFGDYEKINLYWREVKRKIGFFDAKRGKDRAGIGI